MSRTVRALATLLVLSFPAAAPSAAQTSLRPTPEELRLLMNVHAFTRLYGYVRYFHPSDAAAGLDWDRFAVYGLSRVVPAADRDELKAVLEELFRPIAPALTLSADGGDSALPEVGAPEGTSYLAWQHRGLGSGSGDEVFRSVRASPSAGALFAAFPDPGQVVVKPLPDGLSAVLPLSLSTGPEGTLPRSDAGALSALEARLAEVPAWDAESFADRLAPVVVAWTMLRHFHPHVSGLRLDWDRFLIGAIRGMRSARTLADVEEVLLLHLLVPVADGQLRLRHPELDAERAWLPLAVEYVNGELVVSASQVEEVLPGDLLLAVGGSRFPQVLDLEHRRISGSSQHRRAVALERFGGGAPGSEVELELARGERGGQDGETVVRMRRTAARVTPFPRPPVDPLGDGVVYVDLRRLDTARLDGELSRLAAAPAIVFDLRGELRADVRAVAAHLVGEPVEPPQDEVALRIYPDQEETAGWEVVSGAEPWAPAAPRLEGRLTFLADAHTRGAAETLLAVVRDHRLGTIVGQATAAAVGLTRTFALPGGFELTWTLTRRRDPGGEEGLLEGVVPDEEVLPSRDGLRAGRDEVLEKALELIAEKGTRRGSSLP